MLITSGVNMQWCLWVRPSGLGCSVFVWCVDMLRDVHMTACTSCWVIYTCLHARNAVWCTHDCLHVMLSDVHMPARHVKWCTHASLHVMLSDVHMPPCNVMLGDVYMPAGIGWQGFTRCMLCTAPPSQYMQCVVHFLCCCVQCSPCTAMLLAV